MNQVQPQCYSKVSWQSWLETWSLILKNIRNWGLRIQKRGASSCSLDIQGLKTPSNTVLLEAVKVLWDTFSVCTELIDLSFGRVWPCRKFLLPVISGLGTWSLILKTFRIRNRLRLEFQEASFKGLSIYFFSSTIVVVHRLTCPKPSDPHCRILSQFP